MRRNSRAYRLQMIKETVELREYANSSNPMVRHIGSILSQKPVSEEVKAPQRFVGYHYDQSIEGWVNDRWPY